MTNHILLSKNDPRTILLFQASMYNAKKIAIKMTKEESCC